MDQPLGKVDGTITLFRSDGLDGGEWWQCSSHTLKSRTRFWVRAFKGVPERMVLTAERQTDELWSKEASDSWAETQIENRLRSGFRPSQFEGQMGPQGLTDLIKKQMQQPPAQDKTT